MLKDVLLFSKQEFKNYLIIIATITFGFTFFLIHFIDETFISTYITFFIVIAFFFISRILFMKMLAYHYGFEFSYYLVKLNRWGFKNYQRFSSAFNIKDRKDDFGFPHWFISILLSTLSAGFLMIYNIYRFQIKKIPHKFIGTKYRFEDNWLHVHTVTDHRIAKVLFFGYFYYFIFAFIASIFLPQGTFLYQVYFVIFYMAGISLIPLPSFEGYELFLRYKFAYISALVINLIGLLSLLSFTSLTASFFITILVSSIYLGVLYSKKFLANEH
jgi:hypothetical protein